MAGNIKLYPWFQGCRNLLFWQAIWFLYFQDELSAAEAILLAAVYDVGSAVLEVPSGYLSDRIGRRITLIIAVLANIAGALLLAFGAGFFVFALAQLLHGASSAFTSGTDSALLYDSLLEEKREDEVAWHEIRAWRFMFTALALSALSGGLMAMEAAYLPFLATAVTSMLALLLAYKLREPAAISEHRAAAPAAQQARIVIGRLREPALLWLFVLAVSMYVFSHVPFVFGQPFMKQALDQIGFAAQTPLVSGAVVTTMMLVSVAASWAAMPLARLIGSRNIFLLSLAMQIGLIVVLMLTVHPAAIAILLLRMVPNGFTRPFILASIQPKLESSYRATYLSMQSLFGRLLLGGTLVAASLAVSPEGVLPHAALQTVLVGYTVVGLVVFAGLWLTSLRVRDIA